MSDPTPGYVMAPCPFCGNGPVFTSVDSGPPGRVWVECSGCGAEMPVASKPAAIAAWNRRAAASPTVAVSLPEGEAQPMIQWPKERRVKGVYQDWNIRMWPLNYTHWFELPPLKSPPWMLPLPLGEIAGARPTDEKPSAVLNPVSVSPAVQAAWVDTGMELAWSYAEAFKDQKPLLMASAWNDLRLHLSTAITDQTGASNAE